MPLWGTIAPQDRVAAVRVEGRADVVVAQRRAQPAAVHRAAGRVVEVGEILARRVPERLMRAEALPSDLDRVDGAVAQELAADALLVDDDPEGVSGARVGGEVHVALEHLDEDSLPGCDRAPRAPAPSRASCAPSRPWQAHLLDRDLHPAADDRPLVIAHGLVDLRRGWRGTRSAGGSRPSVRSMTSSSSGRQRRKSITPSSAATSASAFCSSPAATNAERNARASPKRRTTRVPSPSGRGSSATTRSGGSGGASGSTSSRPASGSSGRLAESSGAAATAGVAASISVVGQNERRHDAPHRQDDQRGQSDRPPDAARPELVAKQGDAHRRQRSVRAHLFLGAPRHGAERDRGALRAQLGACAVPATSIAVVDR